jgi:dGTPase
MWKERASNQTAQQRSINDHRSPYERDLTRVIHSPAFRKLQRKTQILGTDEGDFHRTRLTHSLEVASIAKSMVRNLKQRVTQNIELLPSDDLISAISLLHDIGHPPFGHGGEVALNYLMRNHGGFESNGQTIRLITKNDSSYGDSGLNLTRRTLLGVLKYPVRYELLNQPQHDPDSEQKPLKVNDWHPPKCYLDCEQDIIDWLLLPLPDADRELYQSIQVAKSAKQHHKSKYYSLDCSIMNIADDIAYGVHDFEDAIQLKLISREEVDTKTFHKIYETANRHEQLPPAPIMLNNLFNKEIRIRKSMIGELVNFFIVSSDITIPDPNQTFETELLKFNVNIAPEAKLLLDHLKKLIYQYVIDSLEARTIEFGGQTVLLRLFKAIQSNPKSLLDLQNREKYIKAQSEHEMARVICDYIANMSDEYAYRMHERLFGFNTRTVFERL